MLLSLVWRDRVWLAVLTVVAAWASIWFDRLRNLIWIGLALLTGGLLLFFAWRLGGASDYTNTVLSVILALSLTGAVVDLIMIRPISDDK